MGVTPYPKVKGTSRVCELCQEEVSQSPQATRTGSELTQQWPCLGPESEAREHRDQETRAWLRSLGMAVSSGL